MRTPQPTNVRRPACAAPRERRTPQKRSGHGTRSANAKGAGHLGTARPAARRSPPLPARPRRARGSVTDLGNDGAGSARAGHSAGPVKPPGAARRCPRLISRRPPWSPGPAAAACRRRLSPITRGRPPADQAVRATPGNPAPRARLFPATTPEHRHQGTVHPVGAGWLDAARRRRLARPVAPRAPGGVGPPPPWSLTAPPVSPGRGHPRMPRLRAPSPSRGRRARASEGGVGPLGRSKRGERCF